MPKLTTAQITKAITQFLAENPTKTPVIFSATQAEADALGTSLDQLRLERTMEEIDKLARETGDDPVRMLFSWASESHEEYERMLEARQAANDQALGL